MIGRRSLLLVGALILALPAWPQAGSGQSGVPRVLSPEAKAAIRAAVDLSHRPTRDDLSREDELLVTEAIRTIRALRDAARVPVGQASVAPGQGQGPPSHPAIGTLRAQADQLRLLLASQPTQPTQPGGRPSEMDRLRERLRLYADEMDAIEAMPDTPARQQRLQALLDAAGPSASARDPGTPALRKVSPRATGASPPLPPAAVGHGR